VPLDVKHLYLNRITIIGDPRDTPDTFEIALRAAAEGRMRVLIDQVLPLSQAVLAHEIAEARDGLGKILLDPTRLN
jgi:NADPH:quinone reductase